MADPVILLVRPGQFMLPDYTRLIVVNTRTGDKSGLYDMSHLLLIDIISVAILLDQKSLRNEALKIDPALKINGFGMNVDIIREIDLRTGDVKKTAWVTASHLPGLSSVHHIVRQSSNSYSQLNRRAQSPERLDYRH
jgi:hypothetical protein